MKSIELILRGVSDEGAEKELRVIFRPVEGTEMHQPEIVIKNSESGLDVGVKLPQANYKKLSGLFEKLETISSEDVKRAFNKMEGVLLLLSRW